MKRNNVVSINRKRDENFSGFSLFSENGQHLSEEKFLKAGSLILAVLLQVICIAIFSSPQSVLFAGGLFTGMAVGLTMYYFYPARVKSYFSIEQAPPNKFDNEYEDRRAA